MRKFVSILLGLTFAACVTVSAQIYYTAGSDPLTRWKSINTEHYEIIYPVGIDSLARVYAANLEAVREDAIVKPLGVNPKRTSVILHAYTLAGEGNDNKRSNSPVRMDLNTSPSMYDYMSEPWEYTTTIGKSRHLGHAYLLDRGAFHTAWYIIGDNMRVLGDALWYNKYYWLGDARVTVTDLSHAGVGRSADYLKGYRTSFAVNDLRDYNRWKLGSYEIYTPGEDVFGYLLQANFRSQKNDYSFSREWADAHRDHPITALLAGTRPDAAGVLKAGYFKEYRDSLAALFQRDVAAREPFTKATTLWEAEYYTEYNNYVYVEDQDAVYAVKSNLTEADQLVKIDLRTGREKFLMYFNPDNSGFNEADGKLYWSETVHKGPWELEDYSEVFMYDTQKGKLKRLTKNTRYFAPVPHDTDDVIAVSENTVDGKSYVTILSPKGTREISVPAPENGSIKEMTWIGDVLYCLIVTGDGLGLYSMDDDGWKTCIAPQWQNIGDLQTANLMLDGRRTEVLLFTSDVDGVSNTYTYNPATRSVLQLVNSPYGVSNAQAYKDGGLIYSRYGMEGYSIVRTAASEFELQPTDMSAAFSFPLADKGSELAGNAYPKPDEKLLDQYQDESRYPSKNYSKLSNMFHVHSWAPFFVETAGGDDGSRKSAALGAMVMSQNKLGTVSAKLGYSYGKSLNSRKWMHGGHASIEFRGGMPRVALSAEVNTSERMEYAHYRDKDGKVVNDYRFADSNKPYYDISLSLYQPFEYSMLGMNASLEPAVSLHINNDKAVDYIGNRWGTANYVRAGISGSLENEIAHAAIYPRWGVGASINHISPAVIGNYVNLFTAQTGLQLSAYLPGFAITHGTHVALDVVNQDWKRGNAVFPTHSLIELPRGFVKLEPEQFDSRNYMKAAIDYAIPVNLGDVSFLNGWVYLRRLQIIPFIDYALCWQYSGGKKEMYSVGSDFIVDNNLFHLGVGLSLGLRYAYNNGSPAMPQQHTFQFLFKAGL